MCKAQVGAVTHLQAQGGGLRWVGGGRVSTVLRLHPGVLETHILLDIPHSLHLPLSPRVVADFHLEV